MLKKKEKKKKKGDELRLRNSHNANHSQGDCTVKLLLTVVLLV